tara:strand:+ start:477 stop:629 length:153 start_codon:yes stop_codon:yes gene_type:complete
MYKICDICEFEKRCVSMERCILRVEPAVEAKAETKEPTKKIKKSIFGKKK